MVLTCGGGESFLFSNEERKLFPGIVPRYIFISDLMGSLKIRYFRMGVRGG